MQRLGLAVLLVFVGCASQPTTSATVQNTAVRNAPPPPEQPPLDAPPPEASPAETSPAEASLPDSPPSGSAVPSTSVPPPPEPPPVPEPRATRLETQQCNARGGTIQPVCMLGKLACVVPYRDGGKPCSDKRDCTGQCLYEGPDPAPPNAAGSCQRTNDPCGCRAAIHHGRVQPRVCLD
jgi:hypothetical protein